MNFNGSSVNLPNGYYFSSRRCIASDQVTGNKFYMYSWDPNSTTGACLASTDGGANFYRVGSLPLYSYHGQLKAVPGNANNLFFCTGFQYKSSEGLLRTFDGGANWVRLPGIEVCTVVGYGKAPSTGSYPTVYIHARIGGVWAVYRSTNANLTDTSKIVWDRLSFSYPLGLFDKCNVITGDMDSFGRVYLGFSGNSFIHGDDQAPEQNLTTLYGFETSGTGTTASAARGSSASGAAVTVGTTQGWKAVRGNVTGLAPSKTKRQNGAYALAFKITSAVGYGAHAVGVANPPPTANKKVLTWVYVPSSLKVSAVRVQAKNKNGVAVDSAAKNGKEITRDTWIPLILTVSSNPGTITTLEVQFDTNGASTGTAYVDYVTTR